MQDPKTGKMHEINQKMYEALEEARVKGPAVRRLEVQGMKSRREIGLSWDQGRCPVCLRWFSLNMDEQLRQHLPPPANRSDRPCAGSGCPPTAVAK